MESELSESNIRLCSLQTALTESHSKIRELEATLSGKLEEQSTETSIREQELGKNCEKIASLEKDLDEQNKASKDLQNELKTTVSLLCFAVFLSVDFLYSTCYILFVSLFILVGYFDGQLRGSTLSGCLPIKFLITQSDHKIDLPQIVHVNYTLSSYFKNSFRLGSKCFLPKFMDNFNNFNWKM